MLERQLLKAQVVYNGLGTPRADGAVLLQGGAERHITATDSFARLSSAYPEAEQRDVGFAISPPLANPHTHLDLSRMSYAPRSYEAFLAAVLAYEGQGLRGLSAAKEGLEKLFEAGICAVGDVVTCPEVMRFLLTHPELTGVAYWEVWNPRPEEAERVFQETVAQLKAFKRLERKDGVKLGLSPHAPHSVSAPLLKKLAQLAKQNELPLQIHLAETASELAMHASARGPLMDFMRPYAPDWQPTGLSPVAYLEHLGVLEAQPSLVHMIHVNEEDVRKVQRAGCTVIHCPRSNETLSCGRFPWALYARHGVSVAVATDGLGSSPSLSVEEEVMAAQRLHGKAASPLALVRAAVKGSYRALGLRPPRFVRGDKVNKLHIWEHNTMYTV